VFKEIVGKVRGVDQWPEAIATVVVAEVCSEGNYETIPSIRLSFYYRDSVGELQSAQIVADNQTSLYNLANDTFTLRFKPNESARLLRRSHQHSHGISSCVLAICRPLRSRVLLLMLTRR
jgi:hypothetical protein